MTNPNWKADIELYRRFQKSPILFTEKVFKLTPQPIKPECKELVDSLVADGRLKEIKAEYFGEFIKNRHITWHQWVLFTAVEIALAGGKRRISVVSGHGTGKSASIAILILWYLFCFKDAQIPCTAPTSSQMHDILWKELALWHKKMPEQIQAKYEWSSEYMRITESPETWFARARTASKENSEALAGVHGDHVMALGDEASGINDEIFSTAEGALTGPNVLVILISNGTRLIGYFYDTHHIDSHNWQTLAFNSEDSPIVDHSFVERIAEKNGTDSDEYAIRVKGGFGKEEGVDDQGFVPLLVEADLREASDKILRGRVRLGIDPAGDGGDKMAQTGRDPFKAKVLTLEDRSTPKSIAGHAIVNIKTYTIDGSDVGVDNFGIGANVAQEIALADNGKNFETGVANKPIRVEAINVGDDAEDSERYFDRRAELAWRLREWIKAGGEFVDVEKWKEELLSIRYRRTTGKLAKIQIMSKQVMKKLGLNHGKSPNKADALMLTFLTAERKQVKYVQPSWENSSEYGI